MQSASVSWLFATSVQGGTFEYLEVRQQTRSFPLYISEGPYVLLIDVDSFYELDYGSLVNLVQLTPAPPAYVCTSNKCVEEDHRPTAHQYGAGF